MDKEEKKHQRRRYSYVDDGGKREEWTIGIIENVRISEDGMVRSGTIRTAKRRMRDQYQK